MTFEILIGYLAVGDAFSGMVGAGDRELRCSHRHPTKEMALECARSFADKEWENYPAETGWRKLQ